MNNRAEDLLQNINHVQARIQKAAQDSGRDPKDVQLVVVSKTQDAQTVESAALAGARILGENYVQEARDKMDTLPTLEVSWHFIGHLQTNKAKYAVRMFDLIHTVDSLKLAREINKKAQNRAKIQDILIQVNVSGEKSKSGAAPEGAEELIREIAPLPHVRVCGLMTMPPYFNNPEKSKPYFATLRKIQEQIMALNIPNVNLKHLSMGMTGDFEAAIAEGATLVRVGTAIFGSRQ